MNIKSLLALTVVSLSTLTSTGYANLTPESEASLNNAAHLCATIATISNAAILVLPHNNEKYITNNNRDALAQLHWLLSRAYAMLDASVEGSPASGSIMRFNRFLEVLASIKTEDTENLTEDTENLDNDNAYFMQWAKDMNSEKAKKITIGVVNFALKEVAYDQAGKALNTYVAGTDTNKRLMRRGITILINTLVESLLDTTEAWAKNKTLKKYDPNYKEIFCNTAIRTAILTAIDQTIGEFIRRKYETNTEDVQQLNEAVKAIEPAASTEITNK